MERQHIYGDRITNKFLALTDFLIKEEAKQNTSLEYFAIDAFSIFPNSGLWLD
jgi:hypothetical protein